MNGNWYFVSLLYRFCPSGERKHIGMRRRCIANENWHIVKAKSPKDAKRIIKRIAQGLCSIPMSDVDSGKDGFWVFIGIKDFWRIDDEIESGAIVVLEPLYGECGKLIGCDRVIVYPGHPRYEELYEKYLRQQII